MPPPTSPAQTGGSPTREAAPSPWWTPPSARRSRRRVLTANPFRWRATLAAAALLAATSNLQAQRAPRVPHIGYVYPTGGQQNTSFEVTVGGQHIKETSEVYISGGGVTVEAVKWYRPLTQGQYNTLSHKIRFTRERLEKE